MHIVRLQDVPFKAPCGGVPTTYPLPAPCHRTIREDIDKKRLEKQLGTQEAAKPAPRPAATDEPAGPNLAIGAVLAILLPAIGFWLLTKQ